MINAQQVVAGRMTRAFARANVLELPSRSAISRAEVLPGSAQIRISGVYDVEIKLDSKEAASLRWYLDQVLRSSIGTLASTPRAFAPAGALRLVDMEHELTFQLVSDCDVLALREAPESSGGDNSLFLDRDAALALRDWLDTVLL